MSERNLAATARAQHGLITLDQAREAGLDRQAVHWRLERGRWERVHDTVYRVAGLPPSYAQRVLAACLAIGPEAAASHRSAAVLHDLLRYREPPIEVTTNRRRSPELDGVVVHRLADHHSTWVMSLDGVPVTNVARTIVDLGAVARLATVEAALDRAVGTRLVTLRDVRRVMVVVARRGRRGVRTARLLLDARGAADVPAGTFSARMASLLRRHNLPRPEPEYQVNDVHGGFIGFVDFAYVSERIAIEVDGYEPHSSLRGFTDGIQRDRLLHEAGWEPLHFAWHEVERESASVADEIRGALTRRQRNVA